MRLGSIYDSQFNLRWYHEFFQTVLDKVFMLSDGVVETFRIETQQLHGLQ